MKCGRECAADIFAKHGEIAAKMKSAPGTPQIVFWPPTATKEWQYDYADWLYPSPERSVDEVWIADQNRRIERD